MNIQAFAPKFKELWENQINLLNQKFAGQIEEIKTPWTDMTDVPIVYVKKNNLVELIEFLKKEPQFDYGFLSDITATDETSAVVKSHPESYRFEVVYQLFSHKTKARLRVKLRVAQDEPVPTLTGLWSAANWAEREIWDMFGISFSGHPDLRRILMDQRFVGHPLRKDYPLRGYQIFSEPMAIQEELLR